MKLKVEYMTGDQEAEIIVRCSASDGRMQQLIEQIRQRAFALEGRAGDRVFAVPPETVLYIESVDGRTFLYAAGQVYESRSTLQELQGQLAGTPFVRVSKSCILNVTHLKHVVPLWNHRLEALLDNGEKLVVNRSYVNELRHRLGLGGTWI